MEGWTEAAAQVSEASGMMGVKGRVNGAKSIASPDNITRVCIAWKRRNAHKMARSVTAFWRGVQQSKKEKWSERLCPQCGQKRLMKEAEIKRN